MSRLVHVPYSLRQASRSPYIYRSVNHLLFYYYLCILNSHRLISILILCMSMLVPNVVALILFNDCSFCINTNQLPTENNSPISNNFQINETFHGLAEFLLTTKIGSK